MATITLTLGLSEADAIKYRLDQRVKDAKAAYDAAVDRHNSATSVNLARDRRLSSLHLTVEIETRLRDAFVAALLTGK